MFRFRSSSSRSIVASESHTITIQQIPCAENLHDDRLQYSVRIIVDDKQPVFRTFYDPCSMRDLDSCTIYLNEILKEGKYDDTVAQTTNYLINKYGRELVKRLGLWELSKTLTHAKLIIEIREADIHQDTRNTIHRLRWEQLEDQELWPKVESRTITVRRVTSQVTKVIGGPAVIGSEPSYVKDKGRVNILLVIARSFEKYNGHYYDIDPGITLSAILQMKRALENKNSGYSIALEVVRPGTFEAFKSHLKMRPKGYFDIVHFDVHGRVRDDDTVNRNFTTHKSYLYFLHKDFLNKSSDNVKNGLVAILARYIANELHYYKVPFAVLNACKSANPFDGDEGNLSRLFSMGNSLRILAMSYNISGAAVKLLCEKFYYSFFGDLNSFSDAASQARKGLRDYRVRMDLYPHIELQDWFVPVTYAHIDRGLHIPSKEKESKLLRIGRSRSRLRISLSSQSVNSLWRSTSSISSYKSSKSDQHDRRAFLTLRIKPNLVFERQLVRDNVVRLYGPSETNNKSFLGYMTDLWRITNFSEQPYEFEAKNYMDSPQKELRKELRKELLGAREYIWGPLRELGFELPRRLTNFETDYVPRPVIIFYEAEALVMEKPSEEQIDRRELLNDFFEEIFLEAVEAYGSRFRAPYLIFVSTYDIQLPSILNFPTLGGESFNYNGRPSTIVYTTNNT